MITKAGHLQVLSLVIAPVGNNSSGLFSPKPMVFINVKAHESVISWGDEMVTYVGVIKTSILKASGVHVIKQERSTEDIQFAGLECSFGVHVGVQIVVSVVTKKTNLFVFEKLNAIGL